MEAQIAAQQQQVEQLVAHVQRMEANALQQAGAPAAAQQQQVEQPLAHVRRLEAENAQRQPAQQGAAMSAARFEGVLDAGRQDHREGEVVRGHASWLGDVGVPLAGAHGRE